MRARLNGIPAATKATVLLNRARVLHRFGTDGQWWSFLDCGDTGSRWESCAGNPETTLAVLEELRADLGLTWQSAVDAVRLLASHPSDPEFMLAYNRRGGTRDVEPVTD